MAIFYVKGFVEIVFNFVAINKKRILSAFQCMCVCLFVCLFCRRRLLLKRHFLYSSPVKMFGILTLRIKDFSFNIFRIFYFFVVFLFQPKYPEARVRFPALPEKNTGSGTESTQPRRYK
jgi:hypothetical protein